MKGEEGGGRGVRPYDSPRIDAQNMLRTNTPQISLVFGIHRIHAERKVEMGRTYSKNEGQGGPNAAQSGNQGEGTDQEDDLADDGKKIL